MGTRTGQWADRNQEEEGQNEQVKTHTHTVYKATHGHGWTGQSTRKLRSPTQEKALTIEKGVPHTEKHG